MVQSDSYRTQSSNNIGDGGDMGEERLYSQKDLDLTVEREVTKQRLSDIERNVANSAQVSAGALQEIKTQIEQVISLIDKQTSEQEKYRNEMRDEIEKNFATKTELLVIQNSIDSFKLRITVTIAAIVGVGLFAAWIITTANGLRSLAHP
jgi:small-conductance mechanosensitive channel